MDSIYKRAVEIQQSSNLDGILTAWLACRRAMVRQYRQEGHGPLDRHHPVNVLFANRVDSLMSGHASRFDGELEHCRRHADDPNLPVPVGPVTTPDELYSVIAKALHNSLPICCSGGAAQLRRWQAQWADSCERVALALAYNDNTFDKVEFLKACGLTERLTQCITTVAKDDNVVHAMPCD